MAWPTPSKAFCHPGYPTPKHFWLCPCMWACSCECISVWECATVWRNNESTYVCDRVCESEFESQRESLRGNTSLCVHVSVRMFAGECVCLQTLVWESCLFLNDQVCVNEGVVPRESTFLRMRARASDSISFERQWASVRMCEMSLRVCFLERKCARVCVRASECLREHVNVRAILRNVCEREGDCLCRTVCVFHERMCSLSARVCVCLCVRAHARAWLRLASFGGRGLFPSRAVALAFCLVGTRWQSCGINRPFCRGKSLSSGGQGGGDPITLNQSGINARQRVGLIMLIGKTRTHIVLTKEQLAWCESVSCGFPPAFQQDARGAGVIPRQVNPRIWSV